MKIVVFDDLPEGGAKRVTFEQIKRLSSSHEIEYVTNQLISKFPFQNYVHDIHRFDFEPEKFHSALRPLSELSIITKVLPRFREAAELINELKPDVVLVRPSRFSQAPPMMNWLKAPSIYFADEWLRLVYEPGLHPLPKGNKGIYEKMRRNWIKAIDFKAISSASRVLVTSTYMQQAFLGAYGIGPRLCTLGVDADYFFPGKNPDNDRFLFVGEPEPINGYELISSLVPALRKKVQVIKFKSGKFRYTEAQIRSFYQNSIATLCLSKDEPFGLAALESMACGTPVIAVDEGGYKDTVVHNKTGIMIERNPDELSRAMIRLMTKEKLKNRLGQSARSRVIKHFSWNNHILELEHYLNEVKND